MMVKMQLFLKVDYVIMLKHHEKTVSYLLLKSNKTYTTIIY